ncbi:MAG TPA: hypothetical protein PKD64_14510 [Pirellulaceae bacterium]|nr:hypothetical protein [Pirellulaceae bacterium]HMO93394.1 hypothetical protein [Pirellulaceae bacterium]HMP70454.1 hypothetical protein [Pirellulaceae bacterium]
MGYLQNFFNEVFKQSDIFSDDFVVARSEQLQAQIAQQLTSDFQLTRAVRPVPKSSIQLSQGFRPDAYHDEETGMSIPVLMAAASCDNAFSIFVQLVQRLGPCVDVVLESSHDHNQTGHVDYYREHIDTPVLVSALWEYEDLLVNDGCTGIAVLNPAIPHEVQFDEHKLLIIYGSPLETFEHILTQNGLVETRNMQFITESEHIHSTSEAYRNQFDELKMRLGIDADAGHIEFC